MEFKISFAVSEMVKASRRASEHLSPEPSKTIYLSRSTSADPILTRVSRIGSFSEELPAVSEIQSETLSLQVQNGFSDSDCVLTFPTSPSDTIPMNRLQAKSSSGSAGPLLAGSLFQNSKGQNAKVDTSKQQHCASVTVKIHSCEPLSPQCLIIKNDLSVRKCEPNKNLLGFSLASGKVLSSSLESLVSLAGEPVPLHSTKWGQHLNFPKGGGNLLHSKPLSSSQILSQPKNCDEVDFSSISPTTPAQLAKSIQDNTLRVVLLDCRTFVCYNTNHVIGALNVSCADGISRKRLLCGRTTLGELVSGPSDAKDHYKKALDDKWGFLVYDDNASDIKVLPVTHPLKVIVTCLQKAGHSVSYLLGGLQAFYKKFNHLCSQPSAPPSRPLLYSPTTPLVDSEVDSAVISQVLPHVYLGNERDAVNRELFTELGITHVLNVTSHVLLHFENEQVKYKRLPASDSGSQNLKQYFKEAVQFIEEVENDGGRVLIHCQAGVSRSSTIAIAYVMVKLSMTMLEAFHFVKSKRPIVAPNFNFMGQLLDFESTLNQGDFRRDDNHRR